MEASARRDDGRRNTLERIRVHQFESGITRMTLAIIIYLYSERLMGSIASACTGKPGSIREVYD